MFNVGDVVCIDTQEYTVMEVNSDERVAVRPRGSSQTFRWHDQTMFTFVASVGPPPSVLTGMTQFFKDKEKLNEASI
jgi:hypothetical protein